MAERPGRGSDQFALRFPEGLRDRVKAVAEASGRSMNTEIVEALSRHVERAELESAGWAWTAPHHQIDADLLASLDTIAGGKEAEVRLLIRDAIREFIVRRAATDEELQGELKSLVLEIVDLVRYQLDREKAANR